MELAKFDASYYEQLNVPFELRWKSGQIKPGPRSKELLKELNVDNTKYMLICNQASSDMRFNLKLDNPEKLKQIYVYPATNNLCDWANLIENASQIHTIDTSFIHLVESYFYGVKSHPQLFFHLARPSGTEFTRKLHWTSISYDKQK